jgi:hypothetical protein
VSLAALDSVEEGVEVPLGVEDPAPEDRVRVGEPIELDVGDPVGAELRQQPLVVDVALDGVGGDPLVVWPRLGLFVWSVWLFGGRVLWLLNGLVLWLLGGLVVWLFGGLVLWLLGGLVVWLCLGLSGVGRWHR